MGIFSSSTDFGGHAGRKKLSAYNVWMLVFVSLGSVSYGYTASIIGTTLGQPSFLEYFELTTRPNGTQLPAATNAIFQTGGVLGTLTLPWSADRFGRKGGLAISALYCLISIDDATAFGVAGPGEKGKETVERVEAQPGYSGGVR